MNCQNVFQCIYSLPGDCRKALAWWRFITLSRLVHSDLQTWAAWYFYVYIAWFPQCNDIIIKEETWSALFLLFFGRFGDGQILLEINFDSKITYSCLRSSESQSASRFLFFVFSPQKGSHGLVETGDKNRNVTDNITFSRAPWMFCE